MTPAVCLCICTYRRPQGLDGLLRALAFLRLGDLPDAALRVVVVDNAPDGSAEPIVARRAPDARFALSYVHERRKGLASARNAALEAGLASGAAWIAFIDDDEAPEPGWLAAHLATLEATGAAASVGPVYPVFASPPPLWARRGGFFAAVDRDAAVDGAGVLRAREAYSGNVVLSRSALAASGLRFDPDFDEIGGEDTAFFRALAEMGHVIAVSPEAVVHEWTPADRVRPGWLVRRWFRTGGVEARLLGAELGARRAHARLRNAGRGLVRIGGGGARLVLTTLWAGWRDPARIVARLFTVARGGGLLAAAFGLGYREYARPQVEARGAPRGPEERRP